MQPDNADTAAPGQPDERPDSQQLGQPDSPSGRQPDGRPGGQPDGQPDGRSGGGPGEQPDGRPGGGPGGQPDGQSDSRPGSGPGVSMPGRDRLKRTADFLFEVSMLRRTPRTGYQFLGSGQENVAEHSFGTAVLGYVLAGMAGADQAKTVLMCLFHDIHEARTGDFNYVNKLYNAQDARRALHDGLCGTGLEEGVLALHDELEEALSQEAELAQDADQLDLMVNLKEAKDLGNPYAQKWMDCSVERLRTPQGRELARAIMTTDHTEWWFLGPDACWWKRKNGKG